MQDADKVQKEVNNLIKDGKAQIIDTTEDMDKSVNKAKSNLSSWAEDGVNQFSEDFEKLTNEAKDTLVGAVSTIKKEAGQGLSQYNAKIQEVADKVPGSFSEKVNNYPWVTISLSVIFGMMLGMLLRPVRHMRR